MSTEIINELLYRTLEACVLEQFGACNSLGMQVGAGGWLNTPAKLGPMCARSKPQPCLSWTWMLQRWMHHVPQWAIAAPSGVFPSQPPGSWSLAECLG